MIQLPKRQGRQLLEALNLGISSLDVQLDSAGENNEDFETSDLMLERDQLARLHDVVLAQVGGTIQPYWSCHDADCAWWNANEDKECENCGEARHLRGA